MREVVIIDGARTPFGEFGGSLKDISANDLGSIVARKAIERSGIRPDLVKYVAFGNALQTSADAIYCARHVGLKAGVPFSVPSVTISKVCGSAMEAFLYGVRLIQLGEVDICLVGGTENLSQAPHVIRDARWKSSLGRGEMEDSLWTALIDSYNNMPMVMTAENLAVKYNISREEQDSYAFRSYTLALQAKENGLLSEETVPIILPDRKANDNAFSTDEHVTEHTLEQLAKMKPASHADGTVTPGNSSGIGDGAAALIIASSRAAKKYKLNVRARVAEFASCGVDPDLKGLGPVPAINMILKKTNKTVNDIDLFEINEAYAAQYIACEKELNLERVRVNVNGGAIALGHPLGATGARLILTLIYEMNRRQAKNGIASLSIGGGQGLAVLLERAEAAT